MKLDSLVLMLNSLTDISSLSHSHLPVPIPVRLSHRPHNKIHTSFTTSLRWSVADSDCSSFIVARHNFLTVQSASKGKPSVRLLGIRKVYKKAPLSFAPPPTSDSWRRHWSSVISRPIPRTNITADDQENISRCSTFTVVRTNTDDIIGSVMYRRARATFVQEALTHNASHTLGGQ